MSSARGCESSTGRATGGTTGKGTAPGACASRASRGRKPRTGRITWRTCAVSWPLGATPLPSAEEYLEGIPSFSAREWNWLKDVAQAVASRKLHYLPRLQRWMRDGWLPLFCSEMPDTSPASGGQYLLMDEDWQQMSFDMGLGDRADFIKHLLHKHDGEARLVRDDWKPWPGDRPSPYAASFWHHQYATVPETRNWLRAHAEWPPPPNRHRGRARAAHRCLRGRRRLRCGRERRRTRRCAC